MCADPFKNCSRICVMVAKTLWLKLSRAGCGAAVPAHAGPVLLRICGVCY